MLRPLLAVILVVVVLVGVWVVPIDVPHRVTVPGKILPVREWTVLRDREGSIGALLRDHARGTVESFAFNRFERGDAVRLTLHPAARPGGYVAPGDTIASLASNETERQLAQLTGALSAVLASLDLYASGEKAAVVDEARTQLARAEELARQNERVLARLRTLRERELIAEQELELVESQQRVLEADIAAARARLDVVQTGAKPQQLALTRAEATALREEIATLTDRLDLFTLTVPIAGRIVRSFGPDTLLTVYDTTAHVVVMPVPWHVHRHLRAEQAIDVAVSGNAAGVTGRLLQLGEAIHRVNGEQVLLVTAALDDASGLRPGAVAACTIRIGSVRLSEYLKRTVLSVFS